MEMEERREMVWFEERSGRRGDERVRGQNVE